MALLKVGNIIPLICYILVVITVLTVITFDDEVQNRQKPDEERKELKAAATQVTGSERRNVFMIANSLSGPEAYPPVHKKCVLEMLEQALRCGELSIKMRQNQRESPKKMAQQYSRSVSEPQARDLKFPVENTEPPDYRKSLP